MQLPIEYSLFKPYYGHVTKFYFYREVISFYLSVKNWGVPITREKIVERIDEWFENRT